MGEYCRGKPKPTHVTGRECLQIIKHKQPIRQVPAFTYQALQKNTTVIPPPKINIYAHRNTKGTKFGMYLRRGDIPVIGGNGQWSYKKPERPIPLRWMCKPQDLDYCYYLPIFIDGLADSDEKLRKLAQYAAMDMIMKAPHKVLPVLPKMILPFKRAFNTRNQEIIVESLKVLQLMVLLGPCVGRALVPYYRQLLGVFNIYKQMNVNMVWGMDTNRENRIGDVIEDTLRMFESCGGPDAYINIKYMIPTFESNVHPKCEVAHAAAAAAAEKDRFEKDKPLVLR